jgi:hypothetical protein
MSRRRRKPPIQTSVSRLRKSIEAHPLCEPCPTCGKRRFLTRKAAKASRARLQTSDPITVYRCGEYWHIGHTPWQIRVGQTARQEWGQS